MPRARLFFLASCETSSFLASIFSTVNIFLCKYFVLYFLQVLSGVVIFGLFHGLAFLPIILSILCPSPYKSAIESTSTWQETKAGTRHTAKVTSLQVKPSETLDEDNNSNNNE